LISNGTINITSPGSTPPSSPAISTTGNYCQLLDNLSPYVTVDVVNGTLNEGVSPGAVNAGTIVLSSIGGNSTLAIQTTLTNSSTGVIDAQAGGTNSSSINGGELINDGEINVGAGVALTFGNFGSATQDLEQDGGEINVLGIMVLPGGYLNLSGGSINSTKPTATSNAGEFDASDVTINVTSPGSTVPFAPAITITNGGHLINNQSPDVTLDVIDSPEVVVAGAVNDGKIALSTVSGNSSLYISTLTNSSTGVIDFQSANTHIVGGDLSNQGEIDVDSGASLVFDGGGTPAQELDQEGGEINVAGYFQLNAVAFKFSGGAVNSAEPTATSNAGEFWVNLGTIDITSPDTTSPAITVAANSAQLVKNLSPDVTVDVTGGILYAEPAAVNDGTIVLGAISGSSTLSIQSALTNKSTGVIEGQGAGPNYVSGNLTNLGTLLVTGTSALNVNGDLIKGASAGISGTEAGISWKGMSAFSSNVAIQISTDGGATYTTALTLPATDMQYTLSGLQSVTTYDLRVIATAPNGGQTIYAGNAIATTNDPNETGWYQFVGLEAADGSMFLPGSNGFSFTENTGPMFAGSTAGTVDNALQGLVNDGSFATDPRPGTVTVYEYTSSDQPTVFSFSNQIPNGQSAPYDLEAWFTAFCKGIAGFFGAGNQNKSADPINYFNGSVDYETTDLTSNALGSTFSQTRSWTNNPMWTVNQHNGSGMIDSSTPTMVQISGNNTVAVVSSTSSIETFELVNGQYVPDSYIPDTLVDVGGEFVLTDTQGNQTRFYDFSSSTPAGRQGQFISSTDAGGILTYVYAWTADGEIQEIRRQDATGTDQESWLYSYLPSTNPNAGLLASVQLRKANGGGGWNVAQQVVYTYYDGTQPYGNKGDLMTANVEDGSGNALGTDYYRYYTPGVSNGYVDGLRYVFGTTAYDQLVAAVGNPFTATNSQVAPYADQYFEYDNKQRVTVHAVAGTGSSANGGIGTYRYSYTLSNNPAGVNSWRYKTIETLPDGNQNIVYSNDLGEVMLNVFHDINDAGNPALDGQQSETFYKYNAAGQIIEEASPSAVTGYDESSPDLLVE
jgi:hypothetical protein